MVLTVLIAVLQVVGFGSLLILLLLLLSGSLGVLFGLLAMRAGRPTGGKVIAAINGMGLLCIALLFLLLALFRLP